MRGLDAVVHGELRGGGLSSSASVLLGWRLASGAVNNLTFTAAELIRSVRRAEIEGV